MTPAPGPTSSAPQASSLPPPPPPPSSSAAILVSRASHEGPTPASVDAYSTGATASSSNSNSNSNGNSSGSSSSSSSVAGLAGSASLPKTCVRCGRHVDLSEGAASADIAASAPSPSSVAFAPSRTGLHGGPHVSPHGSSISTLLATTPAVQEALQMETDRHQICQACLAAEQPQPQPQPQREYSTLQDALVASAAAARPRADETDALAAQPQQSGLQGESSDVDMAEHSGVNDPRPPEAVASLQPDTVRIQGATDVAHPWRRIAPWARLRQQSNDPDASMSDHPHAPLSINVGNMGAGGDALPPLSSDDSGFPPLARTTSAGSNDTISVLTPRIPTSPTRGRAGSPGAVPPSPAAVPPGFSRSQSTTLTGAGGAFAAAAASSSIPVVNIPTRGRHRTTSSSGSIVGSGCGSSNAAGVPASMQGSSRGRRMSGARRLSRSSSSQGPTAASFAGMGEVVSGSAIAEDAVSSDSAAQVVGPSTMTRPRLSLLSQSEIARMMQDDTSPGQVSERTEVPSVFHKPFVHREAVPLRRIIQDEKDEVEAARTSSEQRLVWFDVERPDPTRDISLVRCKSQGRGCLFPGSTFRGTQKSGRMSYDVTVQIANVDLASSYLCGYLNIRGLTDDWPELTTYFDAEIIGQRHGFLTGKWGATEADDVKHWSRFTPFRPIRNTLTKPDLRFNHLNKPFIFMRWKERFLVPDHRVRDINGASFAGFYYVCVELGEEVGTQQPRHALISPASPSTTSPSSPPASSGRRRRSSVAWRRPATAEMLEAEAAVAAGHVQMEDVQMGGGAGRSGDVGRAEGTDGEPAPSSLVPLQQYDPADADLAPIQSGRMSGFYFHENTEPYQQLTLRHVSETTSSTFELR